MGETETALVCLQQCRHSRSLPGAPGVLRGSQDAPICFTPELVRCQGWAGICMEQKRALSPQGLPSGKSNILCPRGYHLPSARGMHLPGETLEKIFWRKFFTGEKNSWRGKFPFPSPVLFPIGAAVLGEQGAKPAQPLAQEAPAPKKHNPVCKDAAPAGHGGMRGAATAALVSTPGLVALGTQVPPGERFQHLGLISWL